ncbi:MAG: peptidyl-prolyl cis-trans isomerase, partial [Holophagae bacterium]|nr:peptidyl-prolyl cis-trans isomerase [Holophagae bacterium]
AREFSECSSKNKGGNLGMFGKEKMVPAFWNGCIKLSIGQISQPVKTQFGYHIIKVTGHKEGKVDSLEESRPHIESDLKFKKAQEVVQKKADEFSKAAKERKGLTVAAEEMKYTVVDSGFFENDPMATINGIGPSARVANAAFSLKLEEISDALKTAEGVIVFQVMGEKAPKILPFEQVAGKVNDDIARTKAQALAMKAAGEFRIGVTPENFNALVKKAKMPIQKIDPVTRQNTPANFIVNKNSDSFEKLFSYDKGQFTEPLADRNGDIILCRITEKVAFNRKDFFAAAQELKYQEMQRRSNDLFTSFIRNARKAMEDAGKIKISKRFQETQLDNKE